VRKYRIGVIHGDGVGPEIVKVTLDILSKLGFNAEFIDVNAGYEFFRKSGKVIEDGGMDVLRHVDAILKGPITTPLHIPTFRSVNLLLRHELGLYVNVRPFRSYRGVSIKDLNLTVIRENSEDLYVGIEGLHDGTAVALKIISEKASERVINYAFNYAVRKGFKKVTVVHKSNVMRVTDGLFRDVFFRVAKKYPQIISDEVIVDAAAYHLVRNPNLFEVIVTENLYGDILTDLIAGVVGSLGLCGSAQIGDSVALFEPVHGSAPDIAGKGLANPIGQLISATLMLEYLGDRDSDTWLARLANVLDKSIAAVVEEGRVLTPDLGGNASTTDVAMEVLRKALHIINTH